MSFRDAIHVPFKGCTCRACVYCANNLFECYVCQDHRATTIRYGIATCDRPACVKSSLKDLKSLPVVEKKDK